MKNVNDKENDMNDKGYKLDDEVMDFFEDKLNEIANEAQDKFGEKRIDGELVLNCASLVAQLAYEAGTSEIEFLYYMKVVYQSMQEDDGDNVIKMFEPTLTAAQKKMMN